MRIRKIGNLRGGLTTAARGIAMRIRGIGNLGDGLTSAAIGIPMRIRKTVTWEGGECDLADPNGGGAHPNGGRAQSGCQNLLIGGLYDFIYCEFLKGHGRGSYVISLGKKGNSYEIRERQNYQVSAMSRSLHDNSIAVPFLLSWPPRPS